MMNLEKASDAVEELSDLPFFLKRDDDAAKLRLAKVLLRMIGTEDQYKNQEEREELTKDKQGYLYCKVTKFGGVCFTPEARMEWLVRTISDNVGRWPENGRADLRTAYCAHFTPADGDETALPSNILDLIKPPIAPIPPKVYRQEPGDVPIGDLQGLIEEGAKLLRPAKSRQQPPAPFAGTDQKGER